MKKLYLTLILSSVSFFSLNIFCQTYTHPTVGMGGTYAGSCMVNTCSGTYYDNGGAGGNYAANVNSIYRTFCPNIAGRCVRATFTAFSMNDTYFLCGGPGSCCDYLTIRNGAYQNAPILYQNCTVSPGTITANNSSGCLTFSFISDGSVQLAGWAATLSCVACGAWVAPTNSDCPSSTVICSNSAFAANSPGPGLVSETCGSCLAGGETYSNWYVFAAQTSGTIGMTITPANPADDYDFALYGPGVSCGALGSPLRCSYSDLSGVTGMNNVAVDASEGVTGDDSWVQQITVTAGQVYYLEIQHWSPPTSGYTVSWQLGGGASLDCTPPLPIQLTDFACNPSENHIGINWSTASEVNNDHFIIEKSTDGINFNQLSRVNGSGNSNETTDYYAMDEQPSFGENYYRLTQVDFDGKQETFQTISCNYGSDLPTITEINVYDLNGHLVFSEKENTPDLQSILSHISIKTGMYILYTTYSDGTTQFKKFVKI